LHQLTSPIQNNFMTKCINSLILFPILLHTLCFLLFPQYLLSQENIFVRQPASQLIITPHQRSNSDPQQVHSKLYTYIITRY
jgi:hypothetical protein